MALLNRRRLLHVGVFALVMVVVACGDSSTTSTSNSSAVSSATSARPASDGVAWETLSSGSEDGVTWKLQQRPGEGDEVCSRLVTDPSPVETERVTGSCDTPDLISRYGMTHGGGATIEGSRTVVAGGLVAEDVSGLRFVTTGGDEFTAAVEQDGWVVVAPTSAEFDRVMIERVSGVKECPILPASDLVAGSPICGP